MKRKLLARAAFVLAYSLVLPTFSASAETITVNPSQGLIRTIARGMEVAQAGDIVEVMPGTYNETLVFTGKGISVVSAEGSANTTIDGSGLSDSVVTFNYEDSETALDETLEGFTITGRSLQGYSPGAVSIVNASPTLRDLNIYGNSGYNGGGINVGSGAPVLEDLVIENNTASANGGGIYITAGKTSIVDSTISGNSAKAGGGIYMLAGSSSYKNLNVFDNQASNGGGGLYIAGGTPLFQSSSIQSNSSSTDGGGAYVAVGSPEFSANTFSSNQATDEGGGLYILTGGPYLHNNVVGSNSAYRGAGIYISSATSDSGGIHLHNNLLTSNVAGNVGGGLYVQDEAPISVQNNVFQNSTGGEFCSVSSIRGQYIFSYNDLYNELSVEDSDFFPCTVIASQSDEEDSNLFEEPLFTSFSDDGDYGNDDFHLQSESLLIDAGDPDLTDPDGTLSDIGPHGGPDDPVDSDGDGMSDAFEYTYGLDPSSDDSDGDLDGDGLSNLDEFLLETDPGDQDTDHDGVDDGTEVELGGDPDDPSDNQPVAYVADFEGVAELGEEVELEGWFEDPNGDDCTYLWSFAELPAESLLTNSDIQDRQTATPRFTTDAEGSFQIELVVNDGFSDSDPAIVTVHVPETVYLTEGDSIQAAIDAAYDGDTISVGPGTYNEQLDFGGKAITVSGAGPGISFIDAEMEDTDGSVAFFNNGEGADSVLEGFTLRNGKATTEANKVGGCVFVNNATPTLRDLTLSACSANTNGGGLYAKWSEGTFQLSDVRVETSQSGTSGGGIYLSGVESELENIQVIGCSADADGGGIYLSQGNHLLHDVTIGKSSAQFSGGGLALGTGSLTLSESFIYENTAKGTETGGGGVAVASDAYILHTVFSGNRASNASGGNLYVRYGMTIEFSLLLDGEAALDGGNLYMDVDQTLTGSHNVMAYARDGGGFYASSGYFDWSYNAAYENMDCTSTDPSECTDESFLTESNYGGVAGSLSSDYGNISVDPGFLLWSSDDDALNDRFNLQQTSDLIDAGDLEVTDFDGSIADIGLYGGGLAEDLDFDDDGVTFGENDCDDWSEHYPSDDNLDGDVYVSCDSFEPSPDDDGDQWTVAEGDCDDTDASVNPDAPEQLDDTDHDCDGTAWPELDKDGDGYKESQGDCDDTDPELNPADLDGDGISTCDGDCDDSDQTLNLDDADTDGYTSCAGDCDDEDIALNPDAAETCNGKDDNCSGEIDEGFDVDQDTFTTCKGDCDDSDASLTPEDADGDTYSSCDGDCDDSVAEVNPDVEEVCDGVDNNCDGSVDEGFDLDDDGVSSCMGDCDDENENVNPNLQEVCGDGLDNNCDELVDPADDDEDGFCGEDDCDDTNPDVNVGATEVCNELDDNCNGEVDEDLLNTYYLDSDNDDYGNALFKEIACEAPEGYVLDNTDCDDDNGAVSPGTPEMCNGYDDDCDELVDENTKTTFYRDQDTDGYGDPDARKLACSKPSGYVTDGSDCDDQDYTVYPGATEVCDGADNNCDGEVDEGLTSTFYQDNDGDGYGDPGLPETACEASEGLVSDNTDCNDSDETIHPNAEDDPEDGLDSDCGGEEESTPTPTPAEEEETPEPSEFSGGAFSCHIGLRGGSSSSGIPVLLLLFSLVAIRTRRES